MKTKDVKTAEQDHAAELTHLATVEASLAERRTELTAGEEPYRDLAYKVSRSENGADEGAEAALQVTRESRSRLKDEIGELELVRDASQDAVTKKTLTLKVTKCDRDSGECRKLQAKKDPRAKHVLKCLNALDEALATFAADDHRIYELAHEAGMSSARLQWLGSQKHVPKSLAASLEKHLGGLLETRPHAVFRDSELWEIEADRSRVIGQDLDRARARIMRTSGNGITHE